MLADKHGIAERRGKLPFPSSWYTGGVATVLEYVYSELEGRRGFYDLIVSDLNRVGLVDIGSLHVTGTRDGYTRQTIKEHRGDRFLDFITEPDSA